MLQQHVTTYLANPPVARYTSTMQKSESQQQHAW